MRMNPTPSSTRRAHRMPFGAERDADGFRFALWAPAAERVELVLTDADGRTHARALQRRDQGWHGLDGVEASPGARYAYRIDGGLLVPDPASRWQPDDVHGASELIDPLAFEWRDAGWRGRPWHEAVIYELHVGTFCAARSYAGVEARLDHLVALGVTALELMPLADFPGRRNWGYDGALLFAPDAAYGRPETLKRLVQSAHRRGLMVFLDVVYNHLGPEGNYLHVYAPQCFHRDRHTPWGPAIDFDGPDAQWVRELFIHNALYWIEEYHLDGLRLDAVDRIVDTRAPDLLDELAARVREGPGAERAVHLVLENDDNDARRYRRDAAGRPQSFTAQWNDDFHHACHALLTGERDGPYMDFGSGAETDEQTGARPLTHLARALAEGFAYQGETSRFRDRRQRGSPSGALPPAAFVNFLQNHDQAGNRAFGERLHHLIDDEAMDAALAVLLLAPAPPLLFMGQEFAAAQPFLFFCDFGPELAQAVRTGRRKEFERSARFADPSALQRMPDPNDPATFARSTLDWNCLEQPAHRRALELHRELIALRRRMIVPLIERIDAGGRARTFAQAGLMVQWRSNDDRSLVLVANLGPSPAELPADIRMPPPETHILLRTPGEPARADWLPRRTVCWAITRP
jgi:malto-oligosyltrehalose trehalohydrolase